MASQAYVAFYVSVVNCAEQAHLFEIPEEIRKVVDESTDATSLAKGHLYGLIAGDFVRLQQVGSVKPGTRELTSHELSKESSLAALEEEVAWAPGQPRLLFAFLTDAGDELLGALDYPEGLEWSPQTAFKPQP